MQSVHNLKFSLEILMKNIAGERRKPNCEAKVKVLAA